jgi:GNAT superfamily N-acetyltransferase
MSRFHKYLHDLRTLPADTLLGYRQAGVSGAWNALAARSLHRLIRTGHLLVFAHSLDNLAVPTAPAGVRIALAEDEDWPALASLVGQREVSRFRALQAAGRRCLVAWRGKVPVGYAWVAHPIGPDVAPWPLPFTFPSTAAYLYNLYVVPSERSSGIGSALAHERLCLARDAGHREGWRMVAPSNSPSLRTVRKTAAGTRAVGELHFLQLLGRTYARFTPPQAG